MSLTRVASLKPNLQTKIRPLLKQARSGSFNSGHAALEYFLMGTLLKREKTNMKEYQSLYRVIKEEGLVDVEFDDVTLLSWKWSSDPKHLVGHDGVIRLEKAQFAVDAVCRIVLTGKLKKDYGSTKGMTKKLEFTWTPSHLWSLMPNILVNILQAEGYKAEVAY